MSSPPHGVSFVDLIFHHARSQPEKPAIILADRVVTYSMVAQGILRVRKRILARKPRPDGLVCVSIGSPIRHLIVGAALFSLGYPVLSIENPEQALSLNLPIAAFVHGTGFPFMIGQNQLIVTDEWFAGDDEPLPESLPGGFADTDAVCCVALSSGTTGRPKPISLSVDAFQKWIMNYYTTAGFGSWERLLSLIGLNSSWGFTVAAHVLFAGRTLLVAATPRDSLQMLAVYGVDAMAATSLQLREITREQAERPVACRQLRVILTGGGLLTRSVLAEARALLCSWIVNLYGSTEAGGTAFSSVDQLSHVEGATGFVAPWAQVEIVDAQGAALAPGTEGVIRIRANCQGAPYPPERAHENESFKDGWFYPGDRGQINADGLLILRGRASNVINVGGLKLAPEVVEDIVRQHPAIVDAVAFGHMGASTEELSVAVKVRHPVSSQHLIEWCAERDLPVSRVFYLDEVPKTQSGKVDRELIRRNFLPQ